MRIALCPDGHHWPMCYRRSGGCIPSGESPATRQARVGEQSGPVPASLPVDCCVSWLFWYICKFQVVIFNNFYIVHYSWAALIRGGEGRVGIERGVVQLSQNLPKCGIFLDSASLRCVEGKPGDDHRIAAVWWWKVSRPWAWRYYLVLFLHGFAWCWCCW